MTLAASEKDQRLSRHGWPQILACASAVFLLQGCIGLPGRATATPLTLTESDSGRHLRLAAGDSFTVRLAENATTGYTWEADLHDTPWLDLTESTTNYPNPEGRVGVGGEAIFRFQVRAPGTGTLALKYRRPWEEGAAKTFTVTLDARAR